MSGFPSLGGGGSQDDRRGHRPRPSCWQGDRPRWPGSSCTSPTAGRATRCDRGGLRDEDVRLHERLLGRDESALLECLDRFGHVVYCTSLAETGDAVVAEAVTQRVFVQLWRRPAAFHPRRGPLVLQLVRATLGSANAA